MVTEAVAWFKTNYIAKWLINHKISNNFTRNGQWLNFFIANNCMISLRLITFLNAIFNNELNAKLIKVQQNM